MNHSNSGSISALSFLDLLQRSSPTLNPIAYTVTSQGNFGFGGIILQHRRNIGKPARTSDGKYLRIYLRTEYVDKQVPVLYDSFMFTKPQRNDGVYKRELLAIVEFSRKNEHMRRAPITSTLFPEIHVI